MEIQVKRVYETADEGEGFRILVDRLWPRGLSKEKARIDLWAKEIAPSDELRRWLGHEGAKWEEFKRLYAEELDENQGEVERLLEKIEGDRVTLVYAAKEEQYNNARALKAYLEARAQKNE